MRRRVLFFYDILSRLAEKDEFLVVDGFRSIERDKNNYQIIINGFG